MSSFPKKLLVSCLSLLCGFAFVSLVQSKVPGQLVSYELACKMYGGQGGGNGGGGGTYFCFPGFGEFEPGEEDGGATGVVGCPLAFYTNRTWCSTFSENWESQDPNDVDCGVTLRGYTINPPPPATSTRRPTKLLSCGDESCGVGYPVNTLPCF